MTSRRARGSFGSEPMKISDTMLYGLAVQER